MWLFTQYGFYSVASNDKDTVIVRARSKAHLENLINKFKSNFVQSIGTIQKCIHRDYRFRMIVKRYKWIQIVSEIAREQTWYNFKDQVAQARQDDPKYIAATHEVWAAMRKLQM